MRPRTELERRHRKSARLALYGSLIATLAAGAGLTHVAQLAIDRVQVLPEGSQNWAEVDWRAEPYVRMFQGYLQVDTNYVDGSEVAGARYLAEQLEAAGIEVHLEQLGERKANLWAVLEGEEPGAVVLHNHIDVEPIRRPELWKHPPFSGKIDPPWIYGRGAFDMKSLTIAQLAAVLELKKKGIRPRKSLIFLATGSEEVGSDLGSRWILRQHPELVRRFEVVLTEGGVVEAVDRRNVKFWGISFSQKQYGDLVVCSPSREQLEELDEDLRTFRRFHYEPRRVPREARIMLERYAATRGRTELRQLLADPDELMLDTAGFGGLPGYLKAMFRNEVYPGRVVETPGGWELTLKVHVLPGGSIEEARRRLVPDWLLWGLDWVLYPSAAASQGSPTELAAFQHLLRGVEESYPGITVGPYFLPWTATDARFFRQAGIPSYGFSPFLILTPDTYTGNSPNERVSLPGFLEGVHLYASLVEELVR